MEVMTEEILFELEQIKLSNEEETTIIKESIRFLTEEKNNLKNEITALNNTVEELKKNSSKKKDEMKKNQKRIKMNLKKNQRNKKKRVLKKNRNFKKT